MKIPLAGSILFLFIQISWAGSSSDVVRQYQALRAGGLNASRVATPENVVMERHGAKITLQSGKIVFFEPVDGKAMGAVFSGTGMFHFTAPSATERAQTKRYAKSETIDERFTEMTLYFSGDGAREITALAASGGAGNPAATLAAARELLREKLHHNAEATALSYALRGAPGYLLAIIPGTKFGTLCFEVAPYDSEAVSLMRIKGGQPEIWNAYDAPLAAWETRQAVDAQSIRIDAAVAPSTAMEASAVVEFTALQSGPQLLRFDLAPSLRVKTVKDQEAGELAFIQETEKKDAALYIAAAAPLEKGKAYRWTIEYGGKDIIEKAGDGNFFVGARSSWFPRPAVPGLSFADRARFQMRLTVPKTFRLYGSGREVSRKTEGAFEVTEWDSDVPSTVAGFNYGKFSTKSAEGEGYKVLVAANSGQTDELAEIRMLVDQNPGLANQLGITSGGLSTTGMAEASARQALAAVGYFHKLFGELPAKTIHVTQQPSGFFGQSWPALVFMPYTAFLDNTMRNQLGLMRSSGMRKFLEAVGPHEISHQWWGHMVTWRDYRDQWISEGFAEYSAALFIEASQGRAAFQRYVDGWREQMFDSAGGSVRPNDAGPLSIGYRAAGEDAPGAGMLIYTKGAYVLHMIRMTMHDYRTGSDARFYEMLKDFTAQHRDAPATTESFAKVVSKHLNRDMSYFFDQWVYNTPVPKVQVEYTLVQEGGVNKLVGTSTLQDVPDGFVVDIPVSFKFKQGTVTGRVRWKAPKGEIKADLPAVPDSVEFNPRGDVLCQLSVKKR